MSRAIWKFPIEITDYQVIDIRAQVVEWLHAGLDPNGEPCVWAIVEPTTASHRHAVAIAGTGHAPPTSWHIGSFTQGPFIWHVFDAAEQPFRAPSSPLEDQ